MTDHVHVYVNDNPRCSTCSRPRQAPAVRVHFTLPAADVVLWLPEPRHQQVIADVLSANPVSTYQIIGRKS